MLSLFFEGRAFTGTTDKPLGQTPIGNPALICFTEELLPNEIMTSIAKQASSPMTTFLSPQDHRYSIRYFSPNGTEVDLCGHATMVSTYFIKKHVTNTQQFDFILNASFHTARFPLMGETTPDGIAISTRSYTSKPFQADKITDQVVKSLGFEPEDVEHIYKTELHDYVFIVRSSKVLRCARPNFNAVINIGRECFPYRTLVLSTLSDEDDFDYEARVFAPLLGINEDIACGSVNCSLAPIWSKLLKKSRVKMFYCTPDDKGLPIVGGVQDILIKDKRLAIRSSAFPVWSQVILSQGPEDLQKQPDFLSLMQRVSKTTGL